MVAGASDSVHRQSLQALPTASQLKGTHRDFPETSLYALLPFVIKIKAQYRIHFTSGKLAKNQNIQARVQRIRPSIHMPLLSTTLCKDL